MFPQNLSRIVRMTLVAAAVSAGLLGANAWAGPADVGGLVLWLEADAARLTKDANNLVSTWADVTDTANNATPDNVAQRDPARRPGWVDKAIGGRPALKFDSGDGRWSA